MLDRSGIAGKISTLSLVVTALIFAAVFGFYHFLTQRNVLELSKKAASVLADETADKIESRLKQIERTAYGLAAGLETFRADSAELDELLINTLNRDELVFGSAIALEPFVYDTTGDPLSIYRSRGAAGDLEFGNLFTSGYDYMEKDWYVDPKRLERPVWSEPYYDEGGGDILMSTFSAPFFVGKEENKIFAGIVTCDVDLRDLSEYLEDLTFNLGSFSLIVDSDGKFLAATDKDLIGESILDYAEKDGNPQLLEIAGKILKSDRGFFSIDRAFGAENAILIYEKIKASDWSVCFVVPKETIYKESVKTARITLIVAVAGFAIIFAAIVIISNKIAKPIKTVSLALDYLSVGKLKDASDVADSIKTGLEKKKKGRIKNEIFGLKSSIILTINKLNFLLRQISRTGENVISSSGGIGSAAVDLEAAVVEQVASAKETDASTKQIADTSKRTAQNINDLADKINSAAEFASKEKSKLQKMSGIMEDLVGATGEFSKKLSVINKKSVEINEILSTIQSISERTNILSLKAAIEAEKQETSRKGFVVISRDINNLSETTSSSATKISKMITDMQKSVSSGVMEMDKFNRQIKTGAEEIEEIIEGIEEVVEEIRKLAPEFNFVDQTAKSQSESAAQISEAMSQLTKAAEQTKASLKSMKNVAVELESTSSALDSEIRKFSLINVESED